MPGYPRDIFGLIVRNVEKLLNMPSTASLHFLPILKFFNFQSKNFSIKKSKFSSKKNVPKNSHHLYAFCSGFATFSDIEKKRVFQKNQTFKKIFLRF